MWGRKKLQCKISNVNIYTKYYERYNDTIFHVLLHMKINHVEIV